MSVRGLSLVCILSLGASGCLLPDPVTHLPINDEEWAITVDGVNNSHAWAIAALHERARRICGSSKYTFRSEFDADTLIGYVNCPPRPPDPKLVEVETRRRPTFGEKPVSSRVMERDGQRCLQGLDAAGNVVEEYCEVLETL